jgi:hypothetical protein
MTRYIIPFTFGKDMNAVEVCELLKKHNIYIGAQTSYVNNEYLIKGTMENLIKFFMDLDGPAQSFNVEEFEDYVYENQVAAFA